MRADLNVPLDDGTIADDQRIRAAHGSMQHVLDAGGRLVVMSHLGRPGGLQDPELGLAPVASRLSELLDRPVPLPGDMPVCDAAADAVSAMADGDVVLLQNLRFDAREQAGDEGFAAALAEMGDIYCNEAFGAAHRADASLVALPRAMGDRPRVSGLLLAHELRCLREAFSDPTRPFIAVLGGSKVFDKLGVIEQLVGRADCVLVGGAMAYTFLAASGIDIGDSIVETDRLQETRAILESAADRGTRILLPQDHVTAASIDDHSSIETCAGAIGAGRVGLDIGPASATAFSAELAAAATIVWNGPMGMFEVPPFDAGTAAVADAVAEATARGATTIVGGGDSAAALAQRGLSDAVTHLSTGGGACLAMLQGVSLPGVEVLDDALGDNG